MKVFVKQEGVNTFNVYRNNENGELLGTFTDAQDAAKFVISLIWAVA